MAAKKKVLMLFQFFHSKLPWDMTFAYSLTYGNNNREKQITGNSIMISAMLI
jgi:hypothetical protein